MSALVQHKFIEHPHKDVRPTIDSCLSEITQIKTPIAPYNDINVLRKVLQMIIKRYHGLQDVKGHTFGKRAKILETMTRVKLFTIIIDLKCKNMILQMFQCFLTEIRKYHPNNVRAWMQTIVFVILDEDDDICKKLQSNLLAIWWKEQAISPIAYEFSKNLVEHKIEKFKELLTEEELTSLGLQASGSPKKSKKQMRREHFFLHVGRLGHNKCGVNEKIFIAVK
ncbi:hypothetical protein SUGI_0996470 [Cryptomeria japonica]|nr:hypothetical protein SUGI_0996470 [Cryptomeria japonica]